MSGVNFIIREFHSSDDCIFGNCLKVVGRKFKRVSSQNFVKIEGPASCWVHKACPSGMCQIVKFSSELADFKNFGYSMGDGFNKKKDLIVEPEEGYDGPDYTGTSKHGGKIYGHTPAESYNVTACGNCHFALGYIDINRQKRSGNIELIQFEKTKEYSKI